MGIPFLWPCFSSWECHPPNLPLQDHVETPAAAVSGEQEKGHWNQENGGHWREGFGSFCAKLEIGGSRASQEVFQRDKAWGDGDLGCPKTLGSQGRFQNSNGMCQGRSQG